jgi:hypothetical protein
MVTCFKAAVFSPSFAFMDPPLVHRSAARHNKLRSREGSSWREVVAVEAETGHEPGDCL